MPKSKSKGPKQPRGETLDREQRARYAEKLLATQRSTRNVVEKLMEKFEVCKRTAHSDVQLARESIKAEDDDERPHRKRVMRSTWRRFVAECMDAGRFQSAARGLIELGRLDGLYDPKRIEVSGSVGVTVTHRMLVNALDEAGLAALDVVLEQLDKANVKLLPSGEAEPAPAAVTADPSTLS